jgi:hypothetical protein
LLVFVVFLVSARFDVKVPYAVQFCVRRAWEMLIFAEQGQFNAVVTVRAT